MTSGRPVASEPQRSQSGGEGVIYGLARLAWSLREVLTTLAVLFFSWLTGVWLLTGAHLGRGWFSSSWHSATDTVLLLALMFPVLVAAGCLAWPAARGWLATAYRSGMLRRRLMGAFAQIEPDVLGSRSLVIHQAETTTAGWTGRVQVPAGVTFDDLVALEERVASCLSARSVRFVRDPSVASRGRVEVCDRDPWLAHEKRVWPILTAGACRLWDPIPMAVDEHGRPVMATLPETTVLVAGEPGGGKSNLVQMFTAAAALDPTVRLHLLDGKLLELAPWAGCAETFVGPDIDAAIELLERLRTQMEATYATLLRTGRRKIAPGDGLGWDMVVVDELVLFTAMSERKKAARFTELLRDLVARGRAAGVIVICATQKPSSDVVDTSLRDLIGTRWALRCTTPDASDTILGRGWATAGFNAAAIAHSERGVGYLLHEGDQPVLCRAYWLPDEAISELIRAAMLVRNPGSRRALS